MFQSEYRQQNENSFFISDLNITDGYKSKKSNESNTLTHFFSKYNLDLDLENFDESSLNVSYQKVNNDTYLKVFDANIRNTKLKPDNFDILTSEIDVNLENEKFLLRCSLSLIAKSSISLTAAAWPFSMPMSLPCSAQIPKTSTAFCIL